MPFNSTTNNESFKLAGTYIGGVNRALLGTSSNTIDSDLSDANEDIWDRFLESGVPLLKDLESDISTRREDYYDVALDSSQKLGDQRQAQADLRQSALGIATTSGQDKAQKTQESLGRTATEAVGVNASVDAADAVNDSVAATLTNLTTGIETQAINNLSSAAGMSSSRTQQGIMNKNSAMQSNVQAGSSVLGMAAMFAMMS